MAPHSFKMRDGEAISFQPPPSSFLIQNTRLQGALLLPTTPISPPRLKHKMEGALLLPTTPTPLPPSKSEMEGALLLPTTPISLPPSKGETERALFTSNPLPRLKCKTEGSSVPHFSICLSSTTSPVTESI